jgi:acyl-CoA synthetase (AMP-forming)/AMP-acid ligase II
LPRADPADQVPAPVLATPFLRCLLDRATATRPAFTHLDWSGHDLTERTLTWSELFERARTIASRLRELGDPGNRVALTARQDLSYVTSFFGTLYAGMIAVPLFPPDGLAHRGRLVGALNDCAPSVWLTSERLAGKLHDFATAESVPAPREIVAVDSLAPYRGGDLSPAKGGPGDPAYLQYTSGTTREPAGVVVTQRALSAACWQVCQAYDVTESTTCVGWIPFFHDMGLIQLICGPAFAGGRSVFLPPLEFIRRPERWLSALSAHRNVLTAAPNFAYDLVLETVAPERRREFDLSGVSIALNASETVRPATIAAFADAFAPHGFRPTALRPSYGLAEATVYVSSADDRGPIATTFDGRALANGRAEAVDENHPDARVVVSAGRPVGQQVRIVDSQTCARQEDGHTGEIWVHGPNVAAGYWRNSARSQETFDAELEGEGGWLRTGDLGVVHDGLLYVVGRLKELIIIDGRNHYPQDIEETVANAHPAIRRDRVAAFAVADEHGEGVMVVAELVPGADADEGELGRAARAAVATEHDLAIREFRTVPAGTVPRTSSGKIARSAARARFRPDSERLPNG